MFAGPCIAATILICSSGMPKPKCSPFSEFLMLFRNLPSVIGIMSYTCLTRAGFFASWLNSVSFQSDLVYTSCASVSLHAVPKVASAATPVAAVLTNDLRFILFIPPYQTKGTYILVEIVRLAQREIMNSYPSWFLRAAALECVYRSRQKSRCTVLEQTVVRQVRLRPPGVR